MATSASIYFFAGDFADVLKRHAEGADQIYATHNEVAKLIKELVAAGVNLTIYSFITPESREDRPLDGLRIVSLGAKTYNDPGVLRTAIEQDDSDAIVAHFPSIEMLQAVIAKKSRALAVLANSYRTKGLGPFLERRKIARLLNNPRFELVSDHCLPATSQLASMGVARKRLIPWNVPLPYQPADSAPKSLSPGESYKISYAGGIRTNKGVADLIAATAELKRVGMTVHCSFAGGGDIEEMEALGRELGVADQLSFLGLRPNAEVFGMFRAADMVAVPSHPDCTEGFPLTMFEAIASRTPIVCSEHPMFVPVMKDGVTAALYPPANARAFADAIKRVLSDPELYASLSRNADLSWEALKGTADWRTMLKEWILNGAQSPWLQEHTLERQASPLG